VVLNGCRCGDQTTATTTTSLPTNDASTDAPPSRDGEVTAAALPPVCEGKSLSLIQSVTDERCAILHEEWASLAPPTAIRPKAELEPPTTIRFSLTNPGDTTIDLPLRFQAASAQLTCVAEDKDHVLYELAPPTLLDLPSDAGAGEGITDPAKLRAIRQDSILRDGGKARVHSARVRLAAKGSISARFTVNPTIEKRIAPRCDGGSCTPPAKLPKGHYTLHVGQIFVDLGPELARLEIDIP
jgi:hypothetical protein